MRRAGTLGILMMVALALGAVGCGASTKPVASEWSAMQWERIDPSPGPDGPWDVVAFGGRYVGVGGSSAWTSTDLRTWEELPLHGRAVALTEFAGALLAVGSINAQAAIWRSDDGRAWARLAEGALGASAPGYDRTTLDAIAADADAIVAVGTEWGDAGQRPAAWVSVDGRAWQRVPEPFDGGRGNDVVALDHGFVLAGAASARAGEETRGAFWSSSDGLTWSATVENDMFGNREPSAIAHSGGGRIVAVGYGLTATGWVRPALWTSTDGATWSPAPEAAAIGPWAALGPTPIPGMGAIQGTAVTDVEAVADGFLAVGGRWGLDPNLPKVDGSNQMSHRLVVWHSVDGMSWDLLADDPLFALGVSGGTGLGPRHVHRLDDTTVILGVTGDMGTTLWLSSVGA